MENNATEYLIDKIQRILPFITVYVTTYQLVFQLVLLFANLFMQISIIYIIVLNSKKESSFRSNFYIYVVIEGAIFCMDIVATFICHYTILFPSIANLLDPKGQNITLHCLYIISALKLFASPVVLFLLAFNRFCASYFIHKDYHNSKYTLMASVVLLIVIPAYFTHFLFFGIYRIFPLEDYTTNYLLAYASQIKPPAWHNGLSFSDGQFKTTVFFSTLQLFLNIFTCLRLIYIKTQGSAVSTKTSNSREIKLGLYTFLTFATQIIDVAYLYYFNIFYITFEDQTLANIMFSCLFLKQNIFMLLNNIWLPLFSEKLRSGLKKQFPFLNSTKNELSLYNRSIRIRTVKIDN